jgi:hypothetical protein
MQFDFTHWNVLVSWVIIIAELVIGTIPDPPWMRMLAMPVPSIFFIFALETLVFEALYVFEKPAPFRISSIQKGEPMRPAIYPLLEDIIIHSGRGGWLYPDNIHVRGGSLILEHCANLLSVLHKVVYQCPTFVIHIS